jgi:hypothetical protein
VAGVTRSDDLVPLAAVSVLVSLDTSSGIRPLPFAGFALGGVLGLGCAALLGKRFRPAAFWSLLFGFSLLATGVAEQLDLSVVSAGFSFGLFLAIASPLRAAAREHATSVEGAVVLPALFLAGARTSLVPGPALWIAGAALLARLLAGVVVAGLVAAVDPRARRGGGWLALCFVSPGPLGIAIALFVNLRFPGPAGDLILATTFAAAVLGEFIGPPALRRALRRAGEVPA